MEKITFQYKFVSVVLAVLLMSGGPVPGVLVAYADDATSTSEETSQEGTVGQEGDAASSDTIVETGDAAAVSDTQNIVNTNETQVQQNEATSTPAATPSQDDPASTTSDAITTDDATSAPETTDDYASSTPPTLTGTSMEPIADIASTTDCCSASTTVSNDNEATTINETSADASTGDNAATGGGGSATIVTGSAYASANVINVVNTNITNSTGLFEFLNFILGNGYDLRDLDLSYFFNDSSSTGGCSLDGCDSSLTVRNTNSATTTNTVTVLASTGSNTATSTGTTTIATGNAYASANVVNVVNTNLVNSRYLLIALNNFGDLRNDITLPDASFFQRLMARDAGLSAAAAVSNTNAATLTSTTTAIAMTGGNSAAATGDGAGTVLTGDALSNATTYNQVNTNFTGGSTVFLLVNVFGNWSGSVQGLPAGLSWMRTQNGIAITSASGDFSSLESGGDSGCADCASSLDVQNTNNAAVQNDVNVYALTGDNYATSTSDEAQIATGHAYASANVVNLVNTNIIGQNWILAIMNIYGNWSGDLAFGHPDLWIGGVAQASNPTPPGSGVTYTFTVANNGDADATGVVLKALFDTRYLSFLSGSGTNDGNRWALGDIPAGEAREFSYVATAGDPGGGTIAVPLSATVTEDQHDNDPADNTENLTITIGDQLPAPSGRGGGSGDGLYYQDAPKLTVTKTESVSTTTVPATVDYRVVVDNDFFAGPAFDATLTDTLSDPSGKVIYRNSWLLGTVAPGDEITLTYSVQYSADSEAGMYTDTSTVIGFKNYERLPYANQLEPISSSVQLEVMRTGEVLGASTSTVATTNVTCLPLLTTYIRRGLQNDSGEVHKLQEFLNTAGGYNVPVTSIYDTATVAAVKDFQWTHRDDILAPWGISAPTGNVYFTTQREINVLNCGGARSFILSSTQVREIAAYREKALAGTKPSYRSTRVVAPTPATSTAHASIELPRMVSVADTRIVIPEASSIEGLTELVSHWLSAWAGRFVLTASADEQ